MQVILSRQQVEELISEIKDNYDKKAIPLIEDAELELSRQKARYEEAWKNVNDLFGSIEYKKYFPCDFARLIFYGLNFSPSGFYLGSVFRELEDGLKCQASEFVISIKDLRSLESLRGKDFSVSDYGMVSDYRDSADKYESEYRIGIAKMENPSKYSLGEIRYANR